MKKILSVFFVACLFVACGDEDQPQVPQKAAPKDIVFTAGVKSRTVLGADNSVSWKAGDAILVYNGPDASGTDNVATSTAATTGATTTFSVRIVEKEATDDYYAVSPASAATSIAGGVVSAVIPASQTPVSGTFDPSAVVAVAKTAGTNFTFMNAVGLLKFSVTHACGKIVFSAPNIAGGVTISDITASDSPTVTGGTSNAVTMTGSFVPGETYYAAICPGTYAQIEIAAYTLVTDVSPCRTTTRDAVALTCAQIHNVGVLLTI